jgi:hypothetical protein
MKNTPSMARVPTEAMDWGVSQGAPRDDEPEPSRSGLLVWFDPTTNAWVEHRCCHGVEPCDGKCEGGEHLGPHRRVCSVSRTLAESADERLNGIAVPDVLRSQLRQTTLSHRAYTTRQVLLDEVAAYAAANHLAARFFSALDARTPRSGGIAASKGAVNAAMADDLVFTSLVGFLDCGPTTPLRRVDSSSLDGNAETLSPSQLDRQRDVIDALRHFTWSVASGMRAMVDVTSVRGHTVLTAHVHTNTDSASLGSPIVFGPCNGERASLGKLIAAHRCNAVCRMLAMPPLQPLV